VSQKNALYTAVIALGVVVLVNRFGKGTALHMRHGS
jgi:FtsH-binding integral membrane protein